MLTKLKIFGGLALLWAMPFIVSAQPADIDGFFVRLARWINTLLPIIVALALLYFLYGLIKYVMSGGDAEGREAARNIMMWGIIALFVMVSVWGLVAFLGNSVGIPQGDSLDAQQDIPNINF